MIKQLPRAPGARDDQTVRSLRTLLALCAACAMFVAVAFSVVAAPLEPDIATPLPAAQGAVDARKPGA